MDEFVRLELIEIARNIQRLKCSIDCSRGAMRRNGEKNALALWGLLLDNITEEEKLLELSLYKIAEWFRARGEDFYQPCNELNGSLIGDREQ